MDCRERHKQKESKEWKVPHSPKFSFVGTVSRKRINDQTTCIIIMVVTVQSASNFYLCQYVRFVEEGKEKERQTERDRQRGRVALSFSSIVSLSLSSREEETKRDKER